MILTEPDKVASQIQLMRDAETQRGPQRAILNAFFNGEPPWTQEEAKKNQIYVNYNNKQGANLLHQARNQYENAFARRSEYFKVSLPDCDADEKPEYEAAITANINAILKKSREWYYRQDEVWGAVCLHGVGAKVWYDDQEWLPEFKGIQDMLVPTDTHLDMGNLQCLALRRKMRPGQLFRKTLGAGKNVSPARVPRCEVLVPETPDWLAGKDDSARPAMPDIQAARLRRNTLRRDDDGCANAEEIGLTGAGVQNREQTTAGDAVGTPRSRLSLDSIPTPVNHFAGLLGAGFGGCIACSTPLR